MIADAHLHLHATWLPLVWTGALILIAFGALAVLGGIAGIVGNDRLADWIIIRIVPAPLFIGFLVTMIGLFGLWALLVMAALVAFGFVVRPRKTNR